MPSSLQKKDTSNKNRLPREREASDQKTASAVKAVGATLRKMADENGKPRLGRQQIDETVSEIESETPGEDWHHGDWAHLYICQWRFAVTPLLPGTKQAYRSQWQKHPITDAKEAQKHWTETPDDGMGVVLGPSGLVSVDIDSPERATAALNALGIDLDALSHRADIPKIEGAPGRYRLLFRAPSGAALPYQTLAVPRESGKEILPTVDLADRDTSLRTIIRGRVRPS
jgi:hypothetical protein